MKDITAQMIQIKRKQNFIYSTLIKQHFIKTKTLFIRKKKFLRTNEHSYNFQQTRFDFMVINLFKSNIPI